MIASAHDMVESKAEPPSEGEAEGEHANTNHKSLR